MVKMEEADTDRDVFLSDEAEDETPINVTDVDGGARLVKLPNKKAAVWKYFGFTSRADKDNPLCLLCYDTVPSKNANTL